jgi:hypothetical protein
VSDDRCEWIRRIVFGDDFNSADAVIIERQVFKNHWAINLMYAMVACVESPEVILFDALDKFTTFDIPVYTKHKARKRLSIKMAKNILKPIPEAPRAFESLSKQDHIADAFNQIITILFCKNKLQYNRNEMRCRYLGIIDE